ncbi:MAG: hypothetical protein EPO64_02310, partial [Nitrospirae bacterium]
MNAHSTHSNRRLFRQGSLLVLALLLLSSLAATSDAEKAKDSRPTLPFGLNEESFSVPPDNPMTPEKI